jgi:hypothetical protein
MRCREGPIGDSVCDNHGAATRSVTPDPLLGFSGATGGAECRVAASPDSGVNTLAGEGLAEVSDGPASFPSVRVIRRLCSRFYHDRRNCTTLLE